MNALTKKPTRHAATTSTGPSTRTCNLRIRAGQRRIPAPPVGKIDEAHLLSHPQLEALRMLTNHRMDSGALFACLLVGQPTLRRRVKLGVLAALDQRIAVRYHMSGMNLE
ncbi:MAG: AAA family ATPase, partial [Pseudonocardiaceae bacterium]